MDIIQDLEDYFTPASHCPIEKDIDFAYFSVATIFDTTNLNVKNFLKAKKQ